MKTSELLIKAKVVIENPGHWTQGAYAHAERGGERRWSMDEDATCFCSLGALSRVTHEMPNSSYFHATRYLETAMLMPVSVFNDSHTHGQVMAAWDKAIEEAKAKGE